MEAVGECDPAMAIKCLELCQVLISQGKAFTLSLTHTSTSLTFSLDTRGEEKVAKKVEIPSLRKPQARKKPSPSTQRRNARRREEFIRRKNQPPARSPRSPARPPAAPGSWRSSPATNTSLVGVRLTRKPKSDIPQYDGLEEVSDTTEADADEKDKAVNTDSKTPAPEEQKTEDFAKVLKLLNEIEETHEKERQRDNEENEAMIKASFKESLKNNV